MANRRFIDFPIASTVGDSDIILIWQSGANKQTTKATFLSGLPENLDELNDVAISGLTNGQILRYDSVTGKWENTDQGNLDLNDLNDVSIVSPSNGQVLVYNSSTSKWENSSGGYVPYTGAVTTVNLGAQTIQAGQFVKAGGTASQFLKANGSVDSTAYGTGSVTSVALTMPSAFSVANSPVTTAGTLAVTGAGTVGQYIRGDGSLADFPKASGGGSSVSYYLNGSISQGTIGGVAYKELNKVPILGAGTDFTINADGYIASFITDAGDPNLLEIPGGNWNFETYFSASSSGGTPTFYVELYKYDGTTFTLIASSSSSPELIAFGTNLNPYFSTLAVPTTTLALTDRLAIRYYVTHSGRTITLHTENNHLCQVVTTFTTGLTSLNGLTAQVQNLAVGTSGTDFNIASATATHTFNLPTASATNRGALSSSDWSLFTQAYNDKINSAAVTGTTTKTLTLTQQDGGTITASWSDLNTDAVTSVFGRTGAVVAANGDYTTAQVTESGNLYYTEARVSANTDVAANTAARHNAVTLGTANGLSLSTQQLSLALASGSTTGALSSTDWTTFNNKQNALTNPVTGTGTTNYLPKFTGTSTIGNSQIFDNGTSVGVGINSPSNKLDVLGSAASPNLVGTNAYARFYQSGGYANVTIGALASGSFAGWIQTSDGVGTALALSLQPSGGNLLVGTTSDNGAKLQVSTSNLFLASLIGSGGESILRLQNTAINGRNWYIIAGGNIGAFSNGEFGIYDATSSTARLTITSTGAATFSSSVTAANNITCGTGAFDTGGFFLPYSSSSASSRNWKIVNDQQVFGDFSIKQSSTQTGLPDTTRFYIKNDGNVGIGTPSPAERLHVETSSEYQITWARTGAGKRWAIGTDTAGFYFNNRTDSVLPLYITNGGNVLIGTTTDNGSKLNVKPPSISNGGAANFLVNIESGTTTALYIYQGYNSTIAGQSILGTTLQSSDALAFASSNTERMRITSSGYFKAKGGNSTYLSISGNVHELITNVGGNYSTLISNTHPSAPFGLQVYYPNTINDTSNRFIDCEDNTAIRFSVRSNGGLANYQANDVNLSDERTKKDIQPLESYWNKFKDIEIVKFKYKDQTHDDYNIGVIAQQVEQIAPEFVDVDGWGEIIENEEPLKSIYTADLHHATIKVLQEAMAKIEEMQKEIDTLKN